jgi:hypothetical protein
MKFFRAALAAAALALLGAVASAQAQTKWTPFQPPGDGYRIEFPGTPKVVRDTLPSRAGPAPHVTASYESKGYSYSVELTTFASASPPEAVLDLYANGIGKSNRLRAQTHLKIGTTPARRFDVELADGKVIASMLFVTDGTRVYQVLCTTLRGQETSASVKHFINSFVLVP